MSRRARRLVRQLAAINPVIEAMESRFMLSAAPRIISAVADNRGEAVLTVDQSLDPSTVNSASVLIFTAGPDGILGSSDDVLKTSTVTYNDTAKQITVNANLPADTPYHVDVVAGTVAAANGGPNLDGEFNGANTPSGNGTPGGDYQFSTAALASPVAIFTTVDGVIDVPLFATQTPLTVANFETYANAGDWDGTFFHRSVANFVIQAGGYDVTPADSVGNVPANPAVKNEPGISNTVGTIAMAKLGSDPNSATNEWFFNLADNSSNLDKQNGGFTVFGQINLSDSASLGVVNSIAALKVVNAGSPYDSLPVVNYTSGNIDPLKNLAIVSRVAMQMGIAVFVSNQPPTITSANHTAFVGGASGAFTFVSSATPTSTLTETGALPAGVTFTDNGNGTASLAGTPGAGLVGNSYTITVTAANGIGSPASQIFTLTIASVPVITSANNVSFTAGAAGVFTITTTASPIAAITQTGALPAGLTFTDNGNGTATLAGTPVAATGGTYTLTLTANNGLPAAASQVFTLTVNQAAAITSANNASFVAGSNGGFSITSTGFPLAHIAETGALPAGLTFADNGNGTATLTGTPALGLGGNTYNLSLTAANGIGAAAVQTFTLSITQPPAIVSGSSATFISGAAGSFAILTSGFPASAISLVGSSPAGLSLHDNGNGTATLGGLFTGPKRTFNLTLRAANGVGAAVTQAFTLLVLANQTPVFKSLNHASFAAGTSGTFTVMATSVPTATFSESGALPAGLTFTDNHNGTATLTGTPGATTGGSYKLTLSASNGIQSIHQAFTLTVDQPLVINTITPPVFTVGSHNSFAITTTGFPFARLTEKGTLPLGVLFHDNHNGTATLSGKPAAGRGGTYTLTVSAANGISTTATQVFTLTVQQAPAITSANHALFIAGASGSFTIKTTGFPLATVSQTGLPPSLTFTANSDGTATVSGTPAAGSGRTYHVTLTATNGVNPPATQNFTLTIDEPPAIVSANNVAFTPGAASTFAVTTSGFPLARLSEKGALPRGLRFKDNANGTASLSGSTTTTGTFVLTLTATNGKLPGATQTFTLTV